MTAPDTSAEEVERAARNMEEWRITIREEDTAAMLRALLKERDDLAFKVSAAAVTNDALQRMCDDIAAERKEALACIPMDILRAVDAPGATGITTGTPLAAAVRRMTEMGRRLLAERGAARDEAARLREALAFYADRDNWMPTIPGDLSCMGMDMGDRARAALARGGDGG